MSLTSALSVGRSGMAVSQAALEVTGNNMSNVATEGYVRRQAVVVANPTQQVQPGAFIGTGVRLQKVVRIIDEALNSRLRSSLSETSAAATRQELLSSIEVIENELTDGGLSSRLSQFFNTWSDLANNPADSGLRSVVINEGIGLADYLNGLNTKLTTLRTQLDNNLRSAGISANDLLDRIATLNSQIAKSEAGEGGASGPRDERDQLLKELAGFVDIQVFQQPNGTVDVFINSTPIILAGSSRGLAVEFETIDNELEVRLRVPVDGTALEPTTGRIGQLMVSREQDVQFAIDTLNDMTTELMRQINLLHASGQGRIGFQTVTSAYPVSDPTIPLNTGTMLEDLPYPPVNGSFQVHVTQKSTGTRITTLLPVDLDGVGADMTLNDLVAALDGVANISTVLGVDGRMTISADAPDFEFTFSDDTSGVLSSLGINTFFNGFNAQSIEVNQRLISNPNLLAAAKDHLSGDNQTALAINALVDQPLDAFSGISLRSFWRNHIEDFANRTERTNENVAATSLISEGLEAQRQSISGVNIDEEAINMLKFQRAFQGAARFITVVDELMATLLSMAR